MRSAKKIAWNKRNDAVNKRKKRHRDARAKRLRLATRTIAGAPLPGARLAIADRSIGIATATAAEVDGSRLEAVTDTNRVVAEDSMTIDAVVVSAIVRLAVDGNAAAAAAAVLATVRRRDPTTVRRRAAPPMTASTVLRDATTAHHREEAEAGVGRHYSTFFTQLICS